MTREVHNSFFTVLSTIRVSFSNLFSLAYTRTQCFDSSVTRVSSSLGSAGTIALLTISLTTSQASIIQDYKKPFNFRTPLNKNMSNIGGF